MNYDEDPDQHMLGIELDEDEEEYHVLNENPVDVEDREEIARLENNEGLLIVPEDIIVSEEDSFVENEGESESESDKDPHSSNEAEEVIVDDIDDVIE